MTRGVPTSREIRQGDEPEWTVTIIYLAQPLHHQLVLLSQTPSSGSLIH